MTVRHIIYNLFAVVITGTALSSCTSSDAELQEPDKDSVSFGITLKATEIGSLSTRGNDYFGDDDITEMPTQGNELINNWFVAFLKADEIVAVSEGDTLQGVWNDRVNVVLPKGDYSAIAFANMNITELRGRFSVGTHLGNNWKDLVLSSLPSENDSVSEERKLFLSGKVPMSGYRDGIKVSGAVTETYVIEVTRMLSKVEFAVKNISSKTITLSSFSFNPVYRGDIYLFPNHGMSPNNDASHYVMHTMKLNDIVSPDSISERRHFYIKESIADDIHPTNHFHIGLTLKRGNEDKEDVTYALAADQLKWIHRNDYLLFPIVITDYVPEFEVLDYPPIGGYPVNMTSKNNEFYATFSNSGAFDISARLRDSQGRTKAIQEYEKGANQENYVRFVSSTPTGFDLKYEQTLGVWQGNFQHGTNQKIVLTFEFKVGTLIYTRTLHLLSS